MEESGTERKGKEVERKAKEENERVQGTRREGWRIEELGESEARKNGGSRRAEMGRGEGESPRVFGPCLSSSFVPKLRLFSWPSFSRFVHPWAQSRARVRKGERRREKGSDSEESGKEDEARGRRGGRLVET